MWVGASRSRLKGDSYKLEASADSALRGRNSVLQTQHLCHIFQVRSSALVHDGAQRELTFHAEWALWAADWTVLLAHPGARDDAPVRHPAFASEQRERLPRGPQPRIHMS